MGPERDPAAERESAVGEGPLEPTQASVRALLRPTELLAELWWLGPEQELGLPIPHDVRGVVDPTADSHVAVEAHNDPIGLRLTLCSILERVKGPIALSVLLDAEASEEVVATA
jgi:hypothetical protein